MIKSSPSKPLSYLNILNADISDHPAVNLFENLPVAVYTCDSKGYIQSYNKAAVKLWGREPEIGKDLWNGSLKLFNPNGDPIPLEACPMAVTLKEKRAVTGEEIVILRPDGSIKNVLPYPVPTFNNEGELTGAINTLVDITEHRHGDAQQSILAGIIESSDDAIISKNLDGIITSWNSAAQNMFGHTSEEAVGKHITLIIPPERLAEENVIIEKIRNNEKVDHFETVRVTKSGDRLYISLTVSPIKGYNGKVVGASKIARNITAQKMAEEAAKRYTENLQALYTIGKSISEDLDVQRILQKVTDETTRITGAQFGVFIYNDVDISGESNMLYTFSGAPRESFENLRMFRNADVLNNTFNSLAVLRSDDIIKDAPNGNKDLYYVIPEGYLPVVSYLAVPVISQSGVVIGGLFFGHPKPGLFTGEHETIVVSIASQAAVALDNAKLYQEIKVLNARKDEFIGIASHELKTPLTSISGYLQILERNLTNDANIGFVKKTKAQLNKLLTLVADLLDVSKIQTGQLELNLEKFNFNSLVAETIEIAQPLSYSHNITLNSAFEEILVVADKRRIEQVIINLLTNAFKYSPKANTVKVYLTKAEDNAVLTVKDFGIGISSNQQDEVFSRFFRADGLAPHMSGLGLGLYISKEIIDRHHGAIGVKSEVGQGSEFTFSIPISN